MEASIVNNQQNKMPPLALISIYVVENNGVRFLASSLRQNGFDAIEIYLKDYQHHHFSPPTPRELELLIDILRQRQVSLIGLSLRAGGYLRCAASLTALLKENFDTPIIWGGMHVTMAPEECLQYTDYVMLGEGEQALVEVAEHLRDGKRIDDIANVWSRQPDGSIRRNPLRPLTDNLDSLPWRDFHSHSDKYWIHDNSVTVGDPYVSETVYLMMTARGCLFNCSFCDISALRKVFKGLGRFYRTSSPQRVVDECLYAKQHFPKLKRFRFDDELFCMQEDWVAEFSSLYREQVKLPFELLTDPRVVAERPLRLLKEAGLDTIMMGIQNTSEVNARLYNRMVSDEQMIEATRIIHRVGLSPCYQILLDDPHLTAADKQNLFNLLIRFARPYDLYLFSLSYWPRTDITEHYLADGTITA
ncbi:B12-binding domain-containing radical SAM protein, partial [bacterium]|nr:B12-binding domain-containing radical SAM protein [bacterium]